MSDNVKKAISAAKLAYLKRLTMETEILLSSDHKAADRLNEHAAEILADDRWPHPKQPAAGEAEPQEVHLVGDALKACADAEYWRDVCGDEHDRADNLAKRARSAFVRDPSVSSYLDMQSAMREQDMALEKFSKAQAKAWSAKKSLDDVLGKCDPLNPLNPKEG